MAWTPAAKKQDLADGHAIECEVGGKRIALFRRGASFRAIGALCPHKGGPLFEGHVDGDTVICPWHAWTFDLNTGKCLGMPGAVPAYRVKVQGDEVLVDV